MDKYNKKYIRLIKQAKSDQELSDIIDKIYTEGFDDGEWRTEQPPTTHQNKPHRSLAETLDHYKKELHTIIENMESDGLSHTTITSILKQGIKGYKTNMKTR